MDNLRRLYESTDDRGVTGFLFVFVVMLILIEPLYAFIFMYQTGRAFAASPWAAHLYQLGVIGFLFFNFFTVFCLYKLPRHAVKVAKWFLTVRFLFLTFSIISNFLFTLHDPNAIGVRPYQFSSIPDLVIKIVVIPAVYVSVFSIGWYLFLLKSKTVRSNYGAQPEE